jgi:hypothetical protein
MMNKRRLINLRRAEWDWQDREAGKTQFTVIRPPARQPQGSSKPIRRQQLEDLVVVLIFLAVIFLILAAYLASS